MKKKVAGVVSRSAKASRRSDRKRDANPHFAGSGGAAGKLLAQAGGKRGKKRK